METSKRRIVTTINGRQDVWLDRTRHYQTRVAAYCRVSTSSEEQLNSYANQKRFYTEMISKNPEWELVGIYADEGISGTRADKRPEFNKLISDCLNGKIDYIITKSVARFARNTVECLDYVRMLKARGIGVYFEEQGIDTLKIDSELYLVIYAGFAQSESESISKNITWSIRKRYEEGRAIFQYKKMLGYKKGSDGNPEIVPYEADIVVWIFERFLAGDSVNSISLQLKEKNIKIPGKKITFSKAMILSILKNERYCGDCILQKTVTIDCIEKIRVKNDGILAPMYIVENSHPAIISREMFNKVQEELARRTTIITKSNKTSKTAKGRHSKYALTEILKCAECGSRFRRVTWAKRSKNIVVWRCISRLDYGLKYCKDSISVHEDELQRAIVQAINHYKLENRSSFIKLIKNSLGEGERKTKMYDEIDLLERRIDAYNKRLKELVETSLESDTGLVDYENEFKELSENIRQLKQRIETLRINQFGRDSYQERISMIDRIVAESDVNSERYDDELVRRIIECVKVHKDNTVTIVFGGGVEYNLSLGV